MANQQNPNGRNRTDETRSSYRPQHGDQTMRDREDSDRDDTERYGGGQSGYGAGRYGDDRSMGAGYRNQAGGGSGYAERNDDDRFSGRGGEGYWEDRQRRDMGGGGGQWGREHTNYNSGYNQGGMGYGSQGGGMQDRGSQQGFRGGSGGAQMANDYNERGRYPDMYGPSGEHGGEHNGRWGQGGNYTQADSQRGVGYGQGHGFGASRGGQWGGPQSGGMQGNYGQGMQGGYGQGNYGQGMQGRGGNWQQPGGMHRGKGPQGFQRSDDRIKETICEALADDDHIDASHIEVVVKNGEVILTGTVEERRQKRLAEDLVEGMPGVKDVQNQLRVGSSRNQGNQSTGSAVGRNETETSSSSNDKKARA